MANPTRLRGTLLANTWTYARSSSLPGGPATLAGILEVPGSTLPSFAARLMPDQHPPGFAGYAAVGVGFWPLPNIRAGEGALTDWFPYALPAGSYRLMIRQVRGAQARGSYDLWLAGVK